MPSERAPTSHTWTGGAPKQYKILVFGAGAIGAVVGWRLAQASNVRISVICRSNYNAVKTHGFQISSLKWGSSRFIPHSVHRLPKDAPDGPFDYVLCANKVTAGVEQHYQSLGPVVDENTTLVSFQNGINVEEPLRHAFPRNTLVSGIVYDSCRQPGPGRITQDASIRPYLAGLALFPQEHLCGSKSIYDNAKLNDLVRLAGGEFQPLDDLLTARWSKQLWNGAFNPLCAIFRQDTRRLLHHLTMGRSLVERIMSETFDVAIAAGAAIDPMLPQQLVDLTIRSPAIEPSMLQDVRSNRLMEIESLSGNICRLGMKLGVDVTELTRVYGELSRMNDALGRGRHIGSAIEDKRLPVTAPIGIDLPKLLNMELDRQETHQRIAQNGL